MDSKYFSNIIFSKALKLIDNGFLETNDLEKLSMKLGITILQLKQIFNKELNQTPLEYIETSKLNLAKYLLTQTSLSLYEIVGILGFKNLEWFEEVFQYHYNITPTTFREKHQDKNFKEKDTFEIQVSYKPPFRYDDLLNLLDYFCVAGVEKVENGRYYKVIHIKTGENYSNGYMIVGNNEKKHCLEVSISSHLAKVLPQVIFLIKNLFDLYSDPDVVFDGLKRSNTIIKDCFLKGTRIPGSPDDYEICVRAILGQLISMKNTTQVLSAFCEKFGDKVQTGIEGLDYAFPTPERIHGIEKAIIYDEICSLHITRSKVNAIIGITEKFYNHTIDISNCIEPEVLIEKLLTIKGIGKWTSDFIALRAISYSDILMNTDYNIRRILEKKGIPDISIFDYFKPWKSHLTVGLFGLRETVLDQPDKLYKMYYDAPIGKMVIVSKNNKIIGVWIEGQRHYLSGFTEEEKMEMIEKPNHEMLQKAKQWLDQYFKEGKEPTVEGLVMTSSPPHGTKLRHDVWKIVKSIPYGRTLPLSQLIQKIRKKRGITRIATSVIREAIAHNPIAIFIPCHRVIIREDENRDENEEEEEDDDDENTNEIEIESESESEGEGERKGESESESESEGKGKTTTMIKTIKTTTTGYAGGISIKKYI